MKKKLIFSFLFICLTILAFGAISASAATYGDLTYEVWDDEVTITDCNTAATEVNIPEKINGYPVTSIGNRAFYNYDSLVTVTIPDSVTSIGSYAFSNCTSLATITIPDSVMSIGSYAFSNCTSLSEVHITDMAAWCRIDFGSYDANPLRYANKLYLNGALVTKLTIPDSVTSIGSYAFRNCTSLATITIPDSVTSIGDDAFYNCDSLVTVTIGKGVTMIPEKAFYGCGNLQSVCLPAELLYIRNDAFNSCPNIQTVFYTGTEAEWNSVLKYNRNENLTNADIIYQAEQKTYRFVTNCESTIPAITDYAVFVSPAVENENATFLGWFDNEALSGNPVSFPYYGKATTLYAAWTDRTGESFDDAFILKADGEYPVTISESGQLVYYQFVPTVTKNYRFYSTGSRDTYGYLYNKNQSRLTYDNDSGDGSNFSFTYQLTAGETYYIAVKLYSGTGSFTLVSETLVDYKLGGITIKDASGAVLSSIPKGEFFATVSMSNVCATEDSTVVLAQYTDTGAFRGVMYVSTEDLPQGSTINVTIPINTANGDVAQLKAFVWESFTSMTPVGVPVVFPAE
ncbi:MAG: leucine-rich repeat domain-containing protein [Clostridia bacterium]|nr:leucine-rich repeat domain-containing protein [Clostridia bacterium]